MQPRGILSGNEIAQAVERHKKYKDAADNFCDAMYYTDGFSPNIITTNINKLKAWWLKDKPRIVISGFENEPSDLGGALNPGSYNLRLASELLVYECSNIDAKKNNLTVLTTIPEEGLELQPGKLYLGKTVEYTETYNLVAVIDGRSSIGRLGMLVHCTAGYIDPGFRGHITMEIMVIQPLRIYPNMQVAQIRYHSINRGRPYLGKYNNKIGSAAEPSKIYVEFAK